MDRFRSKSSVHDGILVHPVIGGIADRTTAAVSTAGVIRRRQAATKPGFRSQSATCTATASAHRRPAPNARAAASRAPADVPSARTARGRELATARFGLQGTGPDLRSGAMRSTAPSSRRQSLKPSGRSLRHRSSRSDASGRPSRRAARAARPSIASVRNRSLGRRS